MTQHSTRAASPPASNSRRGRLPKGPWPVRLILVAALLLAVPFLFHAGSTVHAADNEITGVTLTSPNPGGLAIAWDAPSRAPGDYRVTWKKSGGNWPSYKNENTAQGGNAFPTGTSHTVSDLEEGTEYSVRVRARYRDGNVEESGPWSTAVELTIAALPDKPTGLSASPSHDSVLLAWTDHNDNSITGYQVLRGPDAANLTVLNNDTGSGTASYTDSTVAAETGYVYAIRARNAHGLSPQSDAVSTTTPAAPPAKPTGLLTGSSHNTVLMFWTDPDDDSITGYQILRGPDAANLAVLTEDTGSTDANYSDDTVEAETTYAYAIQARNAAGLGPQSDTVSVTTQAAPEELLTELALAGVEFIIAGQELDTTGTCSEGDITQIAAECTENITNPMPQFGVVGTLDSDDEVSVRIGRTFMVSTEVADESNLQGPNKRINPTFQPGRNILTIWGDEDGSGPTGAEQHFFRINVVPYWEWNSERLSKDSDCRDTEANAPAVGDITDDDCIVAPQSGNTAELRFFNVINEHFNVYVEVNGTNVISEPSTTDLGSSFTVNLDAGDNLIRIRLAAKGGQPTAEVYDSDSFYYKVTATESTDATLSDLQVHDSLIIGDPAVPLTPAFDPDVTEYYATVANTIVLVALAAKPNDTNATVEFMDEHGSTMTALYENDDFHWVEYDIDVGNNVFRVKVTAEDASTTKTYQVTITREALTLVSNLGQIIDDTDVLGINIGSGIISANATQFTTGTNAAGYEISAVQMDIGIIGNSIPMVSIYSDSTNSPHSSIKVLTNPSNLPSVTRTEYDDGYINIGQPNFAASNLKLEPNKKYWLVIEEASGDDGIIYRVVDTTATDPGGAPGWTINGGKFLPDGDTWTETSFILYPAHFAVRGVLAETPAAPASLAATPGDTQVTLTWTAPASDGGHAITKYQYRVSTDGGSTWSPDWTDVPDSNSDSDQADERSVTITTLINGTLYTFQVRAVNSEGSGIEAEDTATPAAQGSTTLTALVLKDASANTITINPTFAYDVESYNATVANSVDQITVEPTKFDNTSTIKYLDSNDMELTDADATTTGVFDVDLAEGENVIKVEVTSSDAMTKTTYTVRVRRTAADDLVSNLGQPDYSVIVIFPNAVYAMQFTSGTNIAGYTISGVVVNIVSNTSGTFAFAIHETDSTGAFDVPGNKVVDLTGSPTMLGEHTFIPATTTQLDPSTEYFIVITKTSGSATEIQATLSEEEDLVAETGWTIEDSMFSQNSGSTWAVASAGTPEFAVKGEPITPIITLAADFTSIVRELHEVTFTLTRAGSTALAADVTLMVENATGDSVVSTSGQTETLTFQVGDDTVEFAVPLFWLRTGVSTGSFVATVEAGAEYDASGATATVEVVHPTGILINVSLDQNSYQVTEGDDLTFNVVFNVLEEIAAPNRDITFASLVSQSGTARVNDDFTGISVDTDVPSSSWSLVSDRYVATVSGTLETIDDALYERPMGSDESLEIILQGTGGSPPWVTHKGPTTGTTRYPVTIQDNETLTLSAELSSTGLTAGQNLRIDEDAGQTVTLTVTNSDLASNGNPVTLPSGVKLKITPDIPTNRGATETDDWTITPDEIDLDGTATITIVDDMLEEGPESVTFEVGFDDDAAFQSARATLTINDDEYTGPVLQSAAINGRELTLEFSNTLDATSRPARSAFEVKVRGGAVSLSSSNPVSISGSTVTLRLGSAVTAGDTVTVSYTAPGANPIKDDAALEAPSFTDEPVTNNTPNAPATGKPVISGTPQRAETLTVSTSGIRDADGLSNPRYTYQWVRVDGANEVIITGSNSPSYLLTRDDIGKKLLVRVAFFDDAGKTENLESDQFPSSGTIRNKPNNQPTGRPTLSGTNQVGHTLTADTSGIDDQDGLTNPGYTYQWQRREIGVYTDISGADSMVYTLTPDDQGKRVRVQVTFTDDDENVHTLESSPSGVVQAQTSLPSDKVKVSLDATPTWSRRARPSRSRSRWQRRPRTSA